MLFYLVVVPLTKHIEIFFKCFHIQQLKVEVERLNLVLCSAEFFLIPSLYIEFHNIEQLGPEGQISACEKMRMFYFLLFCFFNTELDEESLFSGPNCSHNVSTFSANSYRIKSHLIKKIITHPV